MTAIFFKFPMQSLSGFIYVVVVVIIILFLYLFLLMLYLSISFCNNNYFTVNVLVISSIVATADM